MLAPALGTGLGWARGSVHIALLTHEPFYPPSGGGSAAALYLVRELRSRGHAVDVFGPAPREAQPIERELGILLHPFRSWAMGRTTRWRTAKYLAYPTALARLVTRTVRAGKRYDVLLAQHSISAVAAGTLKRRLGIPIVINLLDCLTGFLETWPPWLMPRPVARALVRFETSLPRRAQADAVLTVSDPLRERILATGYPAERTRAIYYGYDASLFRPAVGPRATTAEVVMHGSFDHHHLGPIAHRAVAEVLRLRPGVRFRFVGPRTPAVDRLFRVVLGAHPTAHLECTGFVPYSEVPGVLATADVGITPYEPSTGTHCAFVAKTVEYLASGLPVVSTPLESALRYYRGLEAVRFSEADGTGFARGVIDWLDRTVSERRDLVEPARQKVAAELDWPRLCARAAETIEGVHGPRA